MKHLFVMSTVSSSKNPKITLRRLKNKPVLRYLRFQVFSTCDWSGAKKHVAGYIIEKNFFLFFFYRYQPIIEQKMAFGSLLGSSK